MHDHTRRSKQKYFATAAFSRRRKNGLSGTENDPETVGVSQDVDGWQGHALCVAGGVVVEGGLRSSSRSNRRHRCGLSCQRLVARFERQSAVEIRALGRCSTSRAVRNGWSGSARTRRWGPPATRGADETVDAPQPSAPAARSPQWQHSSFSALSAPRGCSREALPAALLANK
jgi:hypothetical protein